MFFIKNVKFKIRQIKNRYIKYKNILTKLLDIQKKNILKTKLIVTILKISGML